MRLNKEIVKMVIVLKSILQTTEAVATSDEDLEDDDDKNFEELYTICKKYTEEYDIKSSPNYTAIATRYNDCVRKVDMATLGKEVRPLLLLVAILRKANFDKLRGFEDLKAIDLDAIIAKARIERYLNPLSIQLLSNIFRDHYWTY